MASCQRSLWSGPWAIWWVCGWINRSSSGLADAHQRRVLTSLGRLAEFLSPLPAANDYPGADGARFAEDLPGMAGATWYRRD